MSLDETDLRILRQLQRSGRLTNAELSEQVSLSPSACHRRVARLEREGAISSYVALLDRAALGRKTTVFVEITLAGQSDEVLESFEAAVRRIPEVQECYLMAGTADYLLKVVVRDSEDFGNLHRSKLARLPGVAQMQSSFALKRVRETTELPL
ncbi:Lrp/AsnC family transcriptional regulator [Palleronia caenipelagi]|uniref:Lrp/AsnC family transcriptional regulator n=1 Tax=Palleronia caenipelagi TaxID=2489174 RepID=A0A547PTA1_9RHOB|nr:Lrp/AsnC family transcriptional regulator [Palleronia caenipelagi]TRD17375.1 Lrp/AsnC family transcriptional regulator [Palleronia caenipelagi]